MDRFPLKVGSVHCNPTNFQLGEHDLIGNKLTANQDQSPSLHIKQTTKDDDKNHLESSRAAQSIIAEMRMSHDDGGNKRRKREKIDLVEKLN